MMMQKSTSYCNDKELLLQFPKQNKKNKKKRLKKDHAEIDRDKLEKKFSKERKFTLI